MDTRQTENQVGEWPGSRVDTKQTENQVGDESSSASAFYVSCAFVNVLSIDKELCTFMEWDAVLSCISVLTHCGMTHMMGD
jgi:hypothetical protein